MFQTGHNLRFTLKATNKLRLIGQSGQNDLDSHFSSHGALKRPINGPKAARTDSIT
jgi:hypothetical protein